MLFTHEGVSGPGVLDVSLELARATATAEDFCGVELVVDMWPGKTREEMVERFLEIAREKPKRGVEYISVSTALSSRLVAELGRGVGIEAARRMAQISRGEFRALAEKIKALTMIIKERLGLEEAIVTVGGVATEGLEPRTLESRKVAGLSFAGEILAPAGPCGGYNLLMAFATGQAAGRARSS